MIRLKDIALQAGVSVMTVSKALRDAPDISESTRARLRQLAGQMGYVPDSSAQGLRTKTSRLFGVLIPGTTDPIFSRILSAIEEHAHERGYDLILAHTMNLLEREEKCIRRLLSRRVDGLFISPVYRMTPTSAIYEELRRRRVPTVILGHRGNFCAQFPSVETNDVLASYLVTKHLLELGHQRIAFFSGPAVSPVSQERLEGYRRAHREAQVEIDDKLIFNAGSVIEEGQKAALQLIQESPGATAVQAVNDLVAIGAATTFIQQGVRIPHDLSVAGFGNILTSEFFRVPLTTIRQPKYRMGTAAMEMMVQLLGGEQPEPKRLPAELIVRDSTIPPRSKAAIPPKA